MRGERGGVMVAHVETTTKKAQSCKLKLQLHVLFFLIS